MPTLRESQRRFFELVTAPESVEKTLAARGLGPAFVDEVVVGDARRSAIGRLEIYANMYFFRLHEILHDSYSALAAALGEEQFHNLVTDFLQAHPSENPSVRHIGDRLPDFIPKFNEAPWLRELAALERARLDCFDERDVEVRTLEDVRAIPPEQLAALPLTPVPAHRVLQCRFAVDETWSQADAGEAITPPAESPRTLLVWRSGVDVWHRPMDEDEKLGGTFGELCERLPGETEVAARRGFELLLRWLSDALIAM